MKHSLELGLEDERVLVPQVGVVVCVYSSGLAGEVLQADGHDQGEDYAHIRKLIELINL